MSASYEPVSDFLKAVIAEEIPLTGSAYADANLRHLIVLTQDCDKSNRDWATMLLSQEDVDTPETRKALLRAADDLDPDVRAEALVGIARRDRALALPLVLAALQGDHVSCPTFEAAGMVADATLVEPLEQWTYPSGNAMLDDVIQDALKACRTGVPLH